MEVNRSMVTDLLVDFWYDVDHNEGAGAHLFFTQDGELSFDAASFAGREAIADFYRRRAARGPRVSRHVVSNVRLMPISADIVEVDSVLCLFSRAGVATRPGAIPASVTDVHDRLQVSAAGLLIARRTYQLVFTSPESVPTATTR